MDYRLTDQWADPEGDADARSIEKLLRMPGGFLCFAPPRDAPDPGTLPYDNTGVITFGSLNNLAKVNDGVVAVWAEILASVPRSRLVLKGTALADTYVRERVALRFDKHGIAPDRLDLMAWTASTEAHLGYYRKIDIALDTFPYNGTTTTCEALWMGVPVITLCGEVHAARVGLSLLNQVGMMEFVATTPDAYVAHAITLARDLLRLRELRSGLRARVKQAPLTDAPGFDARLQECYRHAWRQWCERQRLTDRQR
jgi:predicted O-linked N-acetylglucosamine transferase (SPINDLY family)